MAQRIDWIDALKGFAIITVVIGHCATDCMSSGNYPAYKSLINAIYSFIYSFHMPLFFTISGYVFYLSKFLCIWCSPDMREDREREKLAPDNLEPGPWGPAIYFIPYY